MEKFNMIIKSLENSGIKCTGLVNGMIQTFHKNNPQYIINQNPDWWRIATEKEIVLGLKTRFKIIYLLKNLCKN